MSFPSEHIDALRVRRRRPDASLRWAVGVALAAFVVVVAVLLRGMWLAAFS